MANWTGVITNSGNALLREWINEKTLNFDRAAAGTGTVALEGLLAQTALVSEEQEVDILAAEEVDSGLRLKLRISAPETGYSLTQYGVWASVDGGESVLVALFQHKAGGVPIPSAFDTPDFVFTFYALISTSNTGTWTITVDPSAVATKEDVSNAVQAHKEEVDLLLAEKQGTLTGTVNDCVVFDENGAAVAAEKPFGDLVRYGDTLTWDGSTGEVTGEMYYFICPTVLTAADCADGGSVDFVMSGITQTSELTASSLQNSFELDGFALIMSNYILVIPYDGYVYNEVTFPSAGIYFVLYSGRYVASFTINNFVFEYIETKQIDPKFFSFSAHSEHHRYGGDDPLTPDMIHAKSIDGGTEIPEGADLDAYRIPGNFHCTDATIAATLANCPCENGFRLTCGRPTGTTTYHDQEIIDAVTGVRYYRQSPSNADAWSEWTAFIPLPAVTTDDDGKILKVVDGAWAAATSPTVTAIDFTNLESGSFTEVVDGETVTHTVTYDDYGRPTAIDGITITWGDA